MITVNPGDPNVHRHTRSSEQEAFPVLCESHKFIRGACVAWLRYSSILSALPLSFDFFFLSNNVNKMCQIPIALKTFSKRAAELAYIDPTHCWVMMYSFRFSLKPHSTPKQAYRDKRSQSPCGCCQGISCKMGQVSCLAWKSLLQTTRPLCLLSSMFCVNPFRTPVPHKHSLLILFLPTGHPGS